MTQFIVDIEGKHLAQVLLPEPATTPSARSGRRSRRSRSACWKDSASLITDVEKGMAEKDLMGEVVKRI